MANLGEEREQNLRKLNHKRVQHVTTLQQMGKINLEYCIAYVTFDRNLVFCIWI